MRTLKEIAKAIADQSRKDYNDVLGRLTQVSPDFPVMGYDLARGLEKLGLVDLARVDGSKNGTWRVARITGELEQAIIHEKRENPERRQFCAYDSFAVEE